MKCELCNQNLMITGHDLKSEKETDEITIVMDYGCTNAECALFCGVGRNKNIHKREKIHPKKK